VGDFVHHFCHRGYSCHVLHPDSTETTEVDDVERFLAQWTDVFRLEELLFLPPPA
jgi:hypothetical protein